MKSEKNTVKIPFVQAAIKMISRINFKFETFSVQNAPEIDTRL